MYDGRSKYPGMENERLGGVPLLLLYRLAHQYFTADRG